MDFDRQQYIPPETKKHSLQKVLLISVLAHVLIGWWILSQQRIKVPAKVEQETSAINAKLIFFTPPKVQENTVETDAAEQLPEPPAEQIEQSNPVVEELHVDEVVVDEAPETIPAEQEVQTKDVPDIVEPVTPELPTIENDTRREDLPSIDYPGKSDEETPVATSRNLAQKHLLDHSAQANQRMAEQEAQRYRQQRESPDLNLPKFDPYKTEDEKLMEENTIRVDCSSAVNKTLLTVLQYTTGSTMDCSKSQDFEPYIDKHVKKPIKPKDRR
ncbi:hypothetical protein AB6T38_11670 [Aliiglaciecola sp. SL4]|uniref:hypothetical protein n=1 Tax=Aliiglaciecola sp. SL4 TaxID=3239806 RepID=UPI00355B38EE